MASETTLEQKQNALAGLLAALPKSWTPEQRKQFFELFKSTVDFLVPTKKEK